MTRDQQIAYLVDLALEAKLEISLRIAGCGIGVGLSRGEWFVGFAVGPGYSEEQVKASFLASLQHLQVDPGYEDFLSALSAEYRNSGGVR